MEPVTSTATRIGFLLSVVRRFPRGSVSSVSGAERPARYVRPPFLAVSAASFSMAALRASSKL